MNSAQIARALSFREFSTLCGMIDEQLPPSASCDIGGQIQRLAGRLLSHKFNVVKVIREREQVKVFVDLGHKDVKWYVIKYEKVA